MKYGFERVLILDCIDWTKYKTNHICINDRENWKQNNTDRSYCSRSNCVNRRLKKNIIIAAKVKHYEILSTVVTMGLTGVGC